MNRLSKNHCLVLLVLLLVYTQATAVPIKAPRDETDRILGFAPFAARLKQAVRERDAAYIRSLIIPETAVGYWIEWGPSSKSEKQAALKKWSDELGDPAAPFWKSMERYLQWGARWDEAQKEACYPPFDFTGRSLSQGDVLVTSAGVNVRAAPGRSARVLTTLSWEVLVGDMHNPRAYSGGVRNFIGPGPWFLEQGAYYTKVRLADGRVGYVANDFARMYPGWEAHFRQVNGGWKLVAFTHGG